MPAPNAVNEDNKKYAIRKSQSLGGFANGLKVKAKETPSLKHKVNNSEVINEDSGDENDKTPVPTPLQTPNTSRKSSKMGNLFKWFKKQKEDKEQSSEDLYAKIKKTQALRALERSIFSNGTSVSYGLKPASSVDSICSVGSTASFSYVPISKQKGNKKPKVIPMGPTCGSDTYKQRVDGRRKRVVQDLNISLTSKYKLQPAEYSPPGTLLKNENLSAITGPNLPSGPNLICKNESRNEVVLNDPESSDSEEVDDEEESTLSYSSHSRSNLSAMPLSSQSQGKKFQIKAKERKGQFMSPKTINKNALMEIGSVAEEESISEVTGFELSRSDTMEGIQDLELRGETQSTAPTVLAGFDNEMDRLLDVRPTAYIPGKRKAPKPPPPMPPMPPKPLPVGESNYERLGKVAKVNKVQKIDEEGQGQIEPQVEQQIPNLEIPQAQNNMSPRLWFRKSKNKENSTTMPNQNGLQKSKSSSTRPISLLASISDFDREAAKIVQQRQKDEEKRRYINDESFYVKTEQPQEAIDEIMANVEQKMECLDAIGKHNNRWEEKLGAETSQEEQQRESFDMTGLVSDLNQFLNTTRREMMTPKTARKLGQQQQQNEVCTSETNDGKSVEEVSKKQRKAINTCTKVDSEEMDHEAVKTSKKPETVKDKSKGAISKVKPDHRRPKAIKKNNEYEETWNCTKCTLINSVKNKVCILCGASFLNTVAPAPPLNSEKIENNLEKSESSADLILDARDENDEEMPKRGNVLDRVVQFTALQMLSDSRPTSAMNSRTETPRNSANLDGLEQRPLSAMNANEIIFTPTPIVHRVQNKPHNEQKRISMLEKEETTEILAKWKAEHEEREKARRDFFANFQENPVQIKPKDSVLETQKSLLEQASKNLEQRSKVTKEIPKQKEIEKISTSAHFPASNVENVTKQQRQEVLPKGPVKVSNEQKLIRSENFKAAVTQNKENNVANKARKEIVKKQEDDLNAKEIEKIVKEAEKIAKEDEKIAKEEAEKLVQKIFEQPENKTKKNNELKSEPKIPIQNMKKNAKFDPSKTPSSFIQKQPSSQSESSEIESSPPPQSTPQSNFDTSEFLTPEDLTKEVLRQKRLEYFVKIQSPPLTLAKKSTFERQSEVKKAIELDEHMDHYDVPITPARKVPDSFFRQRNLPHPFKKPKMGSEKKKVNSEKRISTSTVSSEYEPILIDSTLEKSKAAKVVKTKKEEDFKKAQQTENPQVHRLEIKALKLSGEMPPKPQPTRPQRRNKFRKSMTPLQQEVRTPIISTRKVEEIDDLVAKQVHNNEPQKPANLERSISVPNGHKPIEAKKSSKKPKMEDFERPVSVLNGNNQEEAKKLSKKPKMDDFDFERSISVPNENKQMEPKKLAKKPRNKRFSKEVNKTVPPSKVIDSEKDKWQKEVQKQRNEVEKLQREIQMLQKEVQTPTRELNPPLAQNQENRGARQKNIVQRNKKNKNMKQKGAYPKEIRHDKVMSGEIVDDVLYIPGPIKKDFKSSKSQAENNEKQIPSMMQAFALIPSDKFDPKNTLTKRKESNKKAKKQISNAPQMDEIHVEATLPSPSRSQSVNRESPKVEDQADIMQRLEEAIAKGNHKEASVLAKEVTKLQISTKLSLKELIEKKNDKKVEKINLNMYVEDRTSYNGPVQVTVKPDFTLTELKEHVQCEFEIPVGVQKWILGKSLAEDDRSKLSSHGITQSGQNIYLYLVAPKEDSETKTAAAVVASAAASASPQTLKKPVEKPMEEYIKGRYWNYEMDRWSYCSSEEDEDEIEVEKNIQKVEDENGDDKENEEEEEGDYEWEYFYEDAEMKKEQQQQKVKVEEKGQKPAGKTQRVNPRDGWECPSCTFLNEPHRPGCEVCTTERPKDYEVPPPGPLDTIPRGATAAAEPAKPAQSGPVPSRLKPLVKEAPKVEEKKENKEKDDILKNYKKLDDLDIIPNAEPFECIICYLDIEPGDGVVLRECLHTFCKECLAGAIEHCDAPQVVCPFKDDSYSCDMTLLDREIKALVSKTVYEKHQQKSLKEAQVSAKNSFHCKTPDCQGFCFVTDDVNTFKCPICKRLNCITCQAIHEGLDCKQYQQATLNEAQDENSLKTKEWIEGLIKGGEALNCPSCQVILLKKWGCDWVRCTYCRTEICWVTKQLRWGPNGRGDTSGGCKCMVDGRTKCHPLCNYCH